VLYFPYDLLLNFEVASDTPIGKKLLEKNFKDILGANIFYCTFILQEMRKKPEDRKFKEYLDTLPLGCRDYPLVFTDKELLELNGCSIIDEI
jgi:hypothetical protein